MEEAGVGVLLTRETRLGILLGVGLADACLPGCLAAPGKAKSTEQDFSVRSQVLGSLPSALSL